MWNINTKLVSYTWGSADEMEPLIWHISSYYSVLNYLTVLTYVSFKQVVVLSLVKPSKIKNRIR